MGIFRGFNPTNYFKPDPVDDVKNYIDAGKHPDDTLKDALPGLDPTDTFKGLFGGKKSKTPPPPPPANTPNLEDASQAEEAKKDAARRLGLRRRTRTILGGMDASDAFDTGRKTLLGS